MRFALSFLLWIAPAAQGDDVALVGVGEEWRYFKGTAPPSPGEEWRQPDFDDRHWPSAPSGFSSSGGGYDGATYLSDMPLGYRSVYFRKKFVVPDPASVRWLVMRLDYDDGFVAYLNGREIARRGFAPDEVVRHDRPAAFRGRALNEEILLPPGTNLLAAGENVLAVQAHNSGPFDFTFAFVPELLANFNRGPFVQNISARGAEIIWRTPEPADATVAYGPTPALGYLIRRTSLASEHAIALTNLPAGQRCYYQVASARDGAAASSAVASFQTLKASGRLSFVVLGDTGTGSRPQQELARVVRGLAPDLVLHTGDTVYPILTRDRVDLRCLSIYREHMRMAPYFFAVGNHDLYAGDAPYLETFYLPTNPVTGTEHFYSFDHGDAHFTFLYAPYFDQYELKAGDAQYEWLIQDLAASAKPWKFIVLHHPIMTSGLHRWDNYNGNQVPDAQELAALILPLAEQYGVQMVFCGHDHSYERFVPTNGVHAVVSGGGGAGLYPMRERDPASARFLSRHHCVQVTVDGPRLDLRALDEAGTEFDAMTIYRELTPDAVYSARWHSPRIGTESAGGGNGEGARENFDFKGSPIPTRAGLFSNLGLVYVNNDRANLYVGFSGVMIHPDNNIFLFIESGRQEGVRDLRTLGNGRVDPDGEGADGLDFLANLSFTNFAPNIGCILGDGNGDGTYRTFARPRLGLNIGQGIFRLDAVLSSVPGTRLEQFHQPAANESPGENAGFIEIAIPLAELGWVRSGDRVRIGAVVAGPGVDTAPDRQTRFLDRAALGRQLRGMGMSLVTLEGVPIELAAEPDADGDGLGDDWEREHGLDPQDASGEQGRAGDPDADGHSNGEEHLTGTDPRNPDSVLRLSVQRIDSFTTRVGWLAVPGRQYFLEYAELPFEGFRPVDGGQFPRTAAGGIETFNVFHRTAAARIYRLRLVP